MNITAGLGEYILQTQTHNTKKLKIKWGGGLKLEPPNLPLGTPVTPQISLRQNSVKSIESANKHLVN